MDRKLAGLFQSTEGDGFLGGMFQRASTWLALSLLLYFPVSYALSPFLLFTLASFFLPGSLLLAFVVAVVAEARSGNLPRIALLVPAAMVLAFYAVALLQHLALGSAEQTLTHQNSFQPHRLDQSSEQVVVPSRYYFSFPDDAATYVEDFKLSEAYANLPATKNASEQWSRIFERKGTVCPAGSALFRRAIGSPLERSSRNHGGRIPVCVEVLPSAPVLSRAILVRTEHTTEDVWGASIKSVVSNVTLADGTQLVWTEASADRWNWVPFLIAGCGVNSYPAGIQCFSNFITQKEVLAPRVPTGYEDSLATAYMLGLERRSPASP